MTAEKEQKTFSFVEMEHEILDFWDQEIIFQRSLKNTKDKKPYIFMTGRLLLRGYRITGI
jgi:Isoleucyl-tRNA synthetase